MSDKKISKQVMAKLQKLKKKSLAAYRIEERRYRQYRDSIRLKNPRTR